MKRRSLRRMGCTRGEGPSPLAAPSLPAAAAAVAGPGASCARRPSPPLPLEAGVRGGISLSASSSACGAAAAALFQAGLGLAYSSSSRMLLLSSGRAEGWRGLAYGSTGVPIRGLLPPAAGADGRPTICSALAARLRTTESAPTCWAGREGRRGTWRRRVELALAHPCSPG